VFALMAKITITISSMLHHLRGDELLEAEVE
jgi:hypothetical protein